ncbi:hypothetical protein FE810_05410 [Thalassotalea litorea]|uniref:Uncharacterized protein n=1 Tax=Thalassotalea litorea TaxID=2020715 RepID=A0A5R9IW60_9GAMM|nr:hypothetical protein [Thalassotalea litorea]TLU66158.1 hypothetical protein FE810_05410 [Thalassotalea litorea]
MGKSSLVVLILGFQFAAFAQQASEPVNIPQTQVNAPTPTQTQTPTQTPTQSQISHSQEPSPEQTRCPGIETLSNKDDPNQIYRRVVRCSQLQEYDRAAELMFVAMSYGKFDSMRVSGKVRHHAAARSRIEAMNKLNAMQLDGLHQALIVKFQNEDERQQLCSLMRSIGQPVYQPEYMLNYQNPLSSRQTHLASPSLGLPTFEQELAWESVFFNFARCSA